MARLEIADEDPDVPGVGILAGHDMVAWLMASDDGSKPYIGKQAVPAAVPYRGKR